MMKKINIICVCCFVALFLSACSNWREDVKQSVQTARGWVDPVPDVNPTISNTKGIRSRVAFGRIVLPIQNELDKMISDVTGQNIPPEMEWVDRMLGSYPWLENVIATDNAGDILLSGNTTNKIFPLSGKEIMALRPNWSDRNPIMLAIKNDSNIVVLCQPFFQNNILQGFVAVSFYMGTPAMTYGPKPSQVAIYLDNTQVYAGNIKGLPAGTNLLADVVKNKNGEKLIKGHKYFWFSNLVGANWLTYFGTVDGN